MKRILKIFSTFLILFCLYPCLVKADMKLTALSQSPVIGSTFDVQLTQNYNGLKIKELHLIVEYDTDCFSVDNAYPAESSGDIRYDTPGKIYIDKYASKGSPWKVSSPVVMIFKALKVGLCKIDLKPTDDASYFEDGSEIPLSPKDMPGISINTVEASTFTRIGTLRVTGYNLSPTFSKTTYNYRVTVPSNVSEVEIVGLRADKTQKVTGTGKRELEYGENKVRVVVIAQNGESCTYEIIITRTDNRTGDTSLKRLSVTSTNIEYKEDQNQYAATVSKSVDSVLITATPSDPNAILTGTGKHDLKIGQNIFTLTVQTVGSDGKSKAQEYYIVITRSEEEFETKTESSKLQSLNINGLVMDLSNDKTKFLYGINKDCNELTINATTESPTAEVKIEGNTKLKNGINLVKIIVTERTEEQTVYQIVVYKDPATAIITNDVRDIEFKEDLLYQTTDTTKNIIPAETIQKLKASGKTFYYNVVNVYNGLLYQIALKENLGDTDLNATITKTSSNPLTYQIEIPENNEIILYLDDTFKDGDIVKIYSYDELGKYTLVTDGIKVDNGYVTFITNNQKYYIFTTSSLIKEKSGFLEFIKNNIYIILIIFGALGGVIAFIIIQNKGPKKDQVKDNEPLY